MSSVTFSYGLICWAVPCSVQQPLHFSATLSIDQHYLSTSSSHQWVNTRAFGLRPTSTSNLPLGKQVLMMPGEAIMRDPDIDPLRSGEQSTELSASPYNERHGREVRRHPRFGTRKTSHKGFACPGGPLEAPHPCGKDRGSVRRSRNLEEQQRDLRLGGVGQNWSGKRVHSLRRLLRQTPVTSK